ncbi:MAG: hypothetical protein ABFS17_11880 [Chloroflexota bacterium]
MQIEFYGTYQKKAYFKAVALIHQPSRRSRIVRLFFFLLFIAIYGTLAINVFGGDTQAAAEISALLGHLISFTVAGSFAFQPYIAAFTQARKDWSDPITHLPIQGIVSEQGVTFNPNANPQNIAWDSFEKIDQGAGYTALVTGDKTMVLLQRSFFQSDREWDTVQRWIDQHTHPNR